MPVQSPQQNRTALRDLIDERGLKYGFVAEKLGISPSKLTRLMNGEGRLQASELLGFQQLLGVSAAAFFDGDVLIGSTARMTLGAGNHNEERRTTISEVTINAPPPPSPPTDPTPPVEVTTTTTTTVPAETDDDDADDDKDE